MMREPTQLRPVYEARFGLMPPDLWRLPMYAVVLAVAVGLILSGVAGGWLAVVVLVGFSYYPAMRAIQAASHRTALRVDMAGITFGVPWPLAPSRAQFVPWSEIAAVVLWRQDEGPVWWRRFVGLQRRGGHSPLDASTPGGPVTRTSYWFLPPYLTPQATPDRWRVYGWRLDRRRFAAAVAHVAPHVAVIDVW